MIKLAVVKETRQSEKRVSITPKVAKQLKKLGVEVMIETGAGTESNFDDAVYLHHGAQIATNKEQLYQHANIACWFKRPSDDIAEIQYIPEQTILIGFLDPLTSDKHIQSYSDKNIIGFAWELLPNLTELESMNAFAKMGELAGKIAYQKALHTINQRSVHKPLTVLVIGTGNAGLAAANAAFQDKQHLIIAGTNHKCRHLIETQFGARFLNLANIVNDEHTLHKQQEQLLKEITQSKPDIIITTARRYRLPAPQLLTKDCLASMKSGSIIEDLTASVGGNTVYTQLDKSIETDHCVLIRNQSNYPSQIPQQASQYYANCIFNLLQRIKPWEHNVIQKMLLKDHLLSKAVITHQKALSW